MAKVEIYLKVFILSLAFCWPSSQDSPNFLHQIVDGNLFNHSSFNFRLFIDDFSGVIIYLFESDSNQFGIEAKGGPAEGKIIRINFNKIVKFVPLSQICGCDPCRERYVTFDVSINMSKIATRCNGRPPEILNIDTKRVDKDESDDNRIYPLPLQLVNMPNKIYIMMGNIGKYTGKDNITTYPRKTKPSGCVDQLYFANRQITLIGDNGSLKPRCPVTCSKSLCNGGSCTQKSLYEVKCDCSFTALNGPRCGNVLKEYIQGKNTSFDILTGKSLVRLKMSWTQLLSKRYCLLEILAGAEVALISIHEGRLLVNNTEISEYSIDGRNFIVVTIVKNFLIINNIFRNESKIPFSLQEMVLLNVGFSKKTELCETFEGAYDLEISTAYLPQDNGPSFEKTDQVQTYDSRMQIPEKSPQNVKEIVYVTIIAVFVFSTVMLAGSVILNHAVMKDCRVTDIPVNNIYEEQADHYCSI